MQVIRLVLALLFCAGAFHPLRSSAQTIVITNGVRTFAGLTNTTVFMSNRCELRITGATNGIPGCVIQLNSRDSFFVLENVEPSSVVASYLPQLRVNGAPAVADSNCRVVQYGGAGAIVIPHPPTFQPLQVFTGPHFTDKTAFLSQYVYYRRTALGTLNATISSFKLKRGYMATFAQNPNGSGISSCYVAQDGDMDVSVLPGNLDNRVRFIYILPWRWVGKKGSCDVSPANLQATWWYNWNISQNSTRDMEYVAIKQQPYWPDLNQNWQTRGVNHLSGYNEPNNPVEDAYENLSPPGSVDDAVARWPELLETGLRVGAPAVTDGGYSWIVDFINKAEAAGHRIDYVPVHYYRSYSNNNNPQGAANNLYSFLKGIYDAVGRPLWVTEFNNGANWTGDADPTFDQNRNVIQAMINMMDDTPWVERYSIYSAVEEVRQTHYNAGGLTPMGTMYRDHVSPVAYLQGLQDNGTRSFAQLNFETNTLDSSGYGNNGVASGSPAYTDGHNGQAMIFDGANTVVTLPPNIATGSSFTFAAWINWGGGGNWQRIFDFGNSTTHYMFLTPSSGGGTLRFAIRSGGSEQMVETSAALPVNQWRQVAITLSGTTARLYVNGVQVSANTAMSINAANFSPRVNFLGKSQFIADPLFRGLMDDVLITDSALSAAQIVSLQTNMPPQFTNSFLSLTNATQGKVYAGSINGSATDANGDTITYSKATGPPWLAVSPSGSLTGVPTGSDVGTNHFTVRVIDSAGESAFAVVTMVVNSSLTGGPALLARYAFNGNATDSSGNANHATTIGSPTFVAGRYGSALDLNGTSQYATLPAGLFASVTNFTIAVWVNWDGGSAFQRIFDFGNDTTDYMFLTPSSSSGTMRFSITTSGAGGEQSLRTSAPPIGQWQHVAITRSANTARLYTNGILATNGTITIAPASFNPVVNYLGESQYAGDPLFNGRLDELYIYNHALGDAEITRLASNQPPPFFPGRISVARTGDNVLMAWPATSLGSRLEATSDGLEATGGWSTIFGSASTNQMSIPINSSGSSVVFRLVYP